MNKRLVNLIAVVVLIALPSLAHERYILPSHTLLSGDKAQTVTLTSSISNDIFHPDRPFGDDGQYQGDLKSLFNILSSQVINAEGKVITGPDWQAYSRMSVADLNIKESGTHRISLVQPDVFMTTFKKADGTPWRLFGKDPTLPDGATNVVRRTTSSRVETFVTLNAPSKLAVQPVGSGLEVLAHTHPNDLFTGENISMQLFFDGAPVKGKVALIRGATRHRNDRNEQELNVKDNGMFSFEAEHAGFYLLTASHDVAANQEREVDIKHYGLMLTLEVFPE